MSTLKHVLFGYAQTGWSYGEQSSWPRSAAGQRLQLEGWSLGSRWPDVSNQKTVRRKKKASRRPTDTEKKRDENQKPKLKDEKNWEFYQKFRNLGTKLFKNNQDNGSWNALMWRCIYEHIYINCGSVTWQQLTTTQPLAQSPKRRELETKKNLWACSHYSPTTSVLLTLLLEIVSNSNDSISRVTQKQKQKVFTTAIPSTTFSH